MILVTNMRNIINMIKDKITLSKLTLLSNPTTLPLHIAVVRTTTHSPSPPNDHRIATVLSLGDSSRATASTIIHSLIHRLHRTTSSTVALKCLYTLHHILTRGPFILKDHLTSVIATTSGGRNHLNLSAFRDGASAATWVLSGWVRWYARYIETIVFASKSVDFVTCSSSSEKEKQQESISLLMNDDLIRDFGSLVGVIEEICKVPVELQVERDRLLHGVMELLLNDYLSMVNGLLVRVTEFKERVDLLSYNDSVELATGLDRLIACKEKSLKLFYIKKISVETLWEMVEELNDKIATDKVQKLGRRVVGVSRLSLMTEL